MCKKRVIILSLCMAAFLGCIGLNKQGAVLLDGREMVTHKVWGKEYILVDDFLRTNYEIQLVDSVLTINTNRMSDYQENPKAIPQINDLHIVVNGSQIDFKRLNGSYALNLNDLCNCTDEDVMELNHEMPIGLASHIDAYYSTFNKLGYSPYRFKMNEDGSIESLHAGSIVESDMGKIEVDQVCEFVSKTEMQHYFSLKALVDGLGARYEIKDYVLTFSGMGEEKIFTIPNVIHNYTMLGYPVLSAEFYAPGANKISAYIDRGVLKVNGKEFAEAFGYTYEEIANENGIEVIIKGKQ